LNQYLSVAFAQLPYRKGLHGIECCLQAHHVTHYHMKWAPPFLAVSWPMQTSSEIGAFGQILLDRLNVGSMIWDNVSNILFCLIFH